MLAPGMLLAGCTHSDVSVCPEPRFLKIEEIPLEDYLAEHWPGFYLDYTNQQLDLEICRIHNREY